jgi:hypothetical protein
LQQPESRVRESLHDTLERVVRGELRVVVTEEEKVAPDVGDAGVAATRDAGVLGERDAPDSRRQLGWLPPVADDGNVELDAALAKE